MQLLIGLILAVIISYIAYVAQSLSRDGAFAAVILGTLIFGLGGWQWAVLLLAFFISSSLLTRAFKNRKQKVNEKYSKGGQRDAAQVLSNGGIAGLFVLLHAFFPQSTLAWAGFAAALAAVTADTWATELGVLNPDPPRLITDLGKSVEKGTSGAISVFGTGASILGAAFIGLLASILFPDGRASLLALVTLSGLFGSLIDSLLGATVQAIYFCPTDQKETEKHPLHSCGTPTIQIRGWTWLNNDWVNALCSCSAVIFIGLFMRILG
jgi:uncharacterized protein (TIGR00297 family)